MPPASAEEELKSLRLLRATLESVSQLLTAVEQDLNTFVGNMDVIEDTTGRLKDVVSSIEGVSSSTGSRGKENLGILEKLIGPASKPSEHGERMEFD